MWTLLLISYFMTITSSLVKMLYLFLVGGGNYIPVRLGIVCDALTAEVLA